MNSTAAVGIDRPAPRTTFAASVAATLPAASKLPAATRIPATPKPPTAPAAAKEKENESDAERPDAGETPAAPPLADWAIPRKKTRWGMKSRIGATAALALIGAAGGYVAYTQFFAIGPMKDGAAPSDAAVTQADDSGELNAAGDLPASRDPFDDAQSPVRPVASSRAAAAKEPRRMGTPTDATPISRRTAAGDRPRTNPLRDSLTLDDEIPEMADDAESRATSRSDASTDDDDSDSLLEAPAESRRRGTAAVNRGSNPAQPRMQQVKPSGGPRFSTIDDDDGVTQELADDKLDGYRVATNRTSGTPPRTSRSTTISTVEGHPDFDDDDKLDGYEPQDVTTRRAVSKTIVLPASEAGRQSIGDSGSGIASNLRERAARATDLGADDDFEAAPRTAARDADDSFARPTRGESNLIQRRSTSALAPTADGRFASPQPAGNSSSVTGPVSDTYRVAPDDSFWKISRKVYGTPRYYQALMRYNQERVPDPQKLRPRSQILTPAAAVLEQRYPDLIEKSAPGNPANSRPTDRSAMRPTFEKPLPGDDADEPAPRAKGDAGAAGYFYGTSGEPLYRIGPDDTLSSIAQKHLGRASRWHEIYEKNQEVLPSPDNLTLGTVIRLPNDASRVSLVPDGDRRR